MTGLRGSRTSGGGFTLIELIVVVVIILVLVGVSVAGVLTVLRRSALSNAVNNVSARITLARSLAQRDGRDTVVLFLRRPISGDAGNYVYEMRVLRLNTLVTPMVLTTLDDRPPEDLPRDVFMHGPNFAGGTQNQWLDTGERFTGAQWWVVWFGPTGGVRLSTAHGDSSMTYAFTYKDVNNVDVAVSGTAVPVPYLALYDNIEFQRSGEPDVSDWLNAPILSDSAKARVLSFNRYTGTLMPEE